MQGLGASTKESAMQLPKAGISPERMYLWGRYVIRALHRAGLTELEERVDAVNVGMLAADRVVFDLAAPVEEARCDRDFLDAKLDDSVRFVQLDLAGRHVGAEKVRPYIDIFPNRIAEYVDATLAEQVTKYRLLCSRLVTHLSEEDRIVTLRVPEIVADLQAWQEAVTAIDTANQALDIARAKLDLAVETWRRTMTEVYGVLLGKFGRKHAERYFPRVAGKKPEAEGEADPAAPVDPGADAPADEPTVESDGL
jgi:hypothetical protein